MSHKAHSHFVFAMYDLFVTDSRLWYCFLWLRLHQYDFHTLEHELEDSTSVCNSKSSSYIAQLSV